MRARPGESAWSLVIFTVLAQASVGLSVVTAILPSRLNTLSALLLLVIGGTAAAFHLGRPSRGRLALSNFGSSPLSREIAFAGLYGAALVVSIAVPGSAFARIVAAVTGVLLVAVISSVYRIRTVPAWDTWMTPMSFFLTVVVLGAAFAARELSGKWHRMDFLDVAALAAILQNWVTRRRTSRFGSKAAKRLLPVQLWFAIAAYVSATLADSFETGAAALFLGSELIARHAFYLSHRRVGL